MPAKRETTLDSLLCTTIGLRQCGSVVARLAPPHPFAVSRPLGCVARLALRHRGTPHSRLARHGQLQAREPDRPCYSRAELTAAQGRACQRRRAAAAASARLRPPPHARLAQAPIHFAPSPASCRTPRAPSEAPPSSLTPRAARDRSEMADPSRARITASPAASPPPTLMRAVVAPSSPRRGKRQKKEPRPAFLAHCRLAARLAAASEESGEWAARVFSPPKPPVRERRWEGGTFQPLPVF